MVGLEAAPVSSSLGSLSRLVVDLRDRWGAEDVARFASEHDVAGLALMHVGGDGRLKVLDFVARSERHLVDILAGGERVDGSSLFPELHAPGARSDILLRPRVETAFLDPFADRPTLAVLCGHTLADGWPLPVSPDTIVRMGAERVAERTGLELWAHGEVEFFLGSASPAEVEVSGEDGYQAAAPAVFGEGLRRRAHAILAGMGVPVKYAHSEVGHIPPTRRGDPVWEQHEVELALAPLPRAADAIVLTRWVLQRVAREAGVRCSFEPVVERGHAGNGLHIHFSLLRDGEHLRCVASDESLTAEAGWLVGGLVLSAPSLMAFGNAHPRSFDRLLGGREVPQEVAWGISDRQALVRIPVPPRTADGRLTAPPTMELRLPDGSAQPHLLLGGAAAALLRGWTAADLPDLLVGTRSRATGAVRRPLPTDHPGIAAALDADRAAYVEPGIFPDALIDRTIAELVVRRPPAH